MKEECCSNCSKGKLERIGIIDSIRCHELSFRATVVGVDGKFTQEIKPHQIRILDIDNFKCDFYKK